MGGIGSGKRIGRKAKKTTEDVPSIDIRLLYRDGYLSTSVEGNFTWSVGGRIIASVGVRTSADRVALYYRQRSLDGEWRPVNQKISIDHTGCNYGGSRKWFLCSKCGRRVAVLYYLTGGFFCRHCHGLTYSSQQESKEDRLMRKARKIRRRLGASENLYEPIWDKPKGMHQSNFERLCNEAGHAQNLSWYNTAERFEKYT